MRTLLAFLLLAVTSRAGTYTVDATGNGDFTDLQAAIDAASAGDTLIVVGTQNNGFPYTVTKSLTIQGGKAGRIQGLQNASYEDTTGLVVDAGASSTVRLLNLTIAGAGNAGGHSSDGLRILSAKRVRVDTCVVLGGLGDHIESSGDVWGEARAADGIDVRSCSEIVVYQSTVIAGVAALIDGGDNSIDRGVDGGHGINLSGAAKAILVRSLFAGGDGGDLCWYWSVGPGAGPTTAYGTNGGAGVFARGCKLVDLGSDFFGGLKGALRIGYTKIPPGRWIPGKDGLPLDLGNRR
jgi:hypothetical protein